MTAWKRSYPDAPGLLVGETASQTSPQTLNWLHHILSPPRMLLGPSTPTLGLQPAARSPSAQQGLPLGGGTAPSSIPLSEPFYFPVSRRLMLGSKRAKKAKQHFAEGESEAHKDERPLGRGESSAAGAGMALASQLSCCTYF